MLFVAAAAAEVRLEGSMTQGGLVFGQAPPGSVVRLDDEPLMVSGDGRFVFGFGRDEQEARRLEVVLPGGGDWTRRIRPGTRDFDIQHVDGLPPDQVTPPPEVLERIREEAELARRARRRRDARTDWADGFIWPVTGPVTGVYGSQRILNGQPRSPHWGLDIAAPTGTPVLAPAAGVVSLVHPDMYFSGGTLIIDHGHGLSSAFLHLSDILVEAGQRVAQGERIGRVGATGRATGPHLDWRMNWGEVRVDPQLLLTRSGEDPGSW